ncbi:MAG TPA: sporulation membrane protein YtaF [Ureibacillus sp.]|nr:sporulation membrane protein YtaF [Ureibacillus sp.]
MSDLVTLLLLGLAVSLDSFTVGLTYGMRKITIPFKSMLIIFLCTFLLLLLAMGFGSFLELFISYEAGETLGGIILIGIGIWVLFQFFTSQLQQTSYEIQKDIKIIEFEIKSLSIVIKILKKPLEADFDKSGNISGKEAFFLGLALSLDSFGAGVGAALIDLPPILFSVVISIASALFIIAGINIGKLFRNVRWMRNLTFLPGIVLILIGIIKI